MDLLTSRAVIGKLYKALSVDPGSGWVGAISNFFDSDQAEETYAWLGQTPAMREWLGGRNAKGLRENNFTIRNKHYEATLLATLSQLRRDKSGQLDIRIAELTRRSQTHWASLLSTLVVNGPATACYDGQFFFDTDHEEGDSGSQSNDISVDISALPVETAGTVTAPAVAEMQFAIAKGIQQIAGLVDDQGEPMNEDASEFIVMTPLSLYHTAAQAVDTPAQVAETQSALTALKKMFNITAIPNVRLDTVGSWNDEFVVFRTDSNVKSFIRQQETDIGVKAKAEGSDFEFDNDAHEYGIDTWRNVGYGYWQNACLVTMT